MLREKLDRGDLRLVVVSLLTVVAGAFYVLSNYSAAFPEASIDLKLSKDEITTRADAFLRAQGLETGGFRNLTLFDPDDDARLFLEREVGLDEANRLMRERISVWRWRARWYRPPQKEEMVVWLSPNGRLVGFDHVIAETAPGARLKPDAAQSIAEAFLARQTGARQRLVEAQLQERPSRHDHVFTWEQEDLRVKDARYRRSIVVHGDRVGRFQEFLYVPEQWKRDFAALRSKNELYSQIAQAFYVPLILCALGVLIQAIRKKQVPWRPLILMSATVGALMIASQWNNLPFFMDNAPTSASYRETLAIGLLLAIGAGVGVFFYVVLAAAAGEPLYRAARPAGMTLRNLATARGIQTREFFRATVVGYGFAAAHLAFVVAFYLIGRRFGVWAPQDIQYSDLLSTSLPWIYPLTISVLAATSEEFWFRLFAIPLLKKWLRSTWIAVLIPAFVWGFLHANYPQQPGYIRGVEVGVIGVAAGFLMLRYGIGATLIWHYTVDAVMIGSYLLRSESWYFRLSGVAVGGAVLAPFLVSLVLYFRRGGFVVEEAPAAELETPPASAEVKPEARESVAPHLAAKWLYVAAAAAGLIALAARPHEFGGFVRLTLTRDRAAQIAGDEMRARGVNLAEWRSVSVFVADLRVREFEYLRRVAGDDAANRTVGARQLTGLWRVRYFKPLQKEEWRVWVRSDAGVIRVDHVLDEKAVGARLTPDQARDGAAAYLRRAQSIQVESLRLVEANQEKRDNRTDHTLVWEDPDFRVGEARARVSVEVIGDEISTFRRFLKLPEQWLREFEKPRLLGYLFPGLLGAAGLSLLIILVRRLGRHEYHWRVYLALGAAAFCLSVAATLNQWPTLLAGYLTQTALENYLGQLALGRLTVALFAAAGVFAGVLGVDVFRQLALGRRRFTPPSAARAASVALMVWGVSRVLAWAGQQVPGPRFSLPLATFPGTEYSVPGFAVLSQAFTAAALSFCLLAIAVFAAIRFLRPTWQIATVLAGAVAFAAGRAQTPALALFYFFAFLAAAAVVWFVIATCAADLVAFAVALFWVQAAEGGARLMAQPEVFFRMNGIGALLGAAVLGWLAIRYSKNGSPGMR
ncbi:MAG: type II CAAX endopeptidase family protein [Bryobacterales bacterium]|nr:type II CAAX endopeptidase family protein [Bryobacterales bacterium]